METLGALIEAGDLNGLLRGVDGLCAAGRWDDLVDLADRCEEAIERGKQLWPIAGHIDYRLALEAPGEYAADVLDSNTPRFSIGPLTEVAAFGHTWKELAGHLGSPHVAAFVAQERVLRGEDLTGDLRAHPEVLNLPLRIEPWEPVYPLASYRSTFVEVAEPWEPRAGLAGVEPVAAGEVDDPELIAAWLDLVAPWLAESNGAARAVVVDGDAVGAVSALTLGPLRVGPLEPSEAIQRMGWAAASGGAHGRRRGGALGRSLAWYTTGVTASTDWPVGAGELEDALGTLRWYRFDEGAPDEGWSLRLAVEHPAEGWAAAIAATDLTHEVLGTGTGEG
ncbi:MAG: hypothetical protein H0W21_12430 [Actinobacteria bacterium]|nr:hypothetical protein [Actinomycetota bacterium]